MNIEQAVIEHLRLLPTDKQQDVLVFIQSLLPFDPETEVKAAILKQIISRDVADLNLHILLKSVGPEQFVASVAELHDCQVTAPSKEAAIEQLQKMVQAHLVETEILSFSVRQRDVVAERENPWTEVIGMYEGDADFAEIMAELRSERGLEPHSSI
jgi:hypothetical protein